jgi:hypothetical protein
MSDFLTIDNELIEKKRTELNLPKPIDFEGGRLKPEDVEKLMPLVLLPFDENFIDKGNSSGFSSKGINYILQLNRLQQVFGVTHVKLEHTVIEKKTVEKDEKQDMFYYKVYVVIKIGNYTIYSNSDNVPDSNFVPYFITEGIGWAGAVNEGTAEKNARANGIKEALKNMGMLRYLYLNDDSNENDDDNSSSSGFNKGTEGTVELLEDATIYSSGTVFMKCRAKDTEKNKEIEVIVYRKNNFNEKRHKEMVEMLEANKVHLRKGKVLYVDYLENMYYDKLQYVIQNIRKP